MDWGQAMPVAEKHRHKGIAGRLKTTIEKEVYTHGPTPLLSTAVDLLLLDKKWEENNAVKRSEAVDRLAHAQGVSPCVTCTSNPATTRTRGCSLAQVFPWIHSGAA